MTFLVATNVVASRPPEWGPTGTSTARAKMGFDSGVGPTCVTCNLENCFFNIASPNFVLRD